MAWDATSASDRSWSFAASEADKGGSLRGTSRGVPFKELRLDRGVPLIELRLERGVPLTELRFERGVPDVGLRFDLRDAGDDIFGGVHNVASVRERGG